MFRHLYVGKIVSRSNGLDGVDFTSLANGFGQASNRGPLVKLLRPQKQHSVRRVPILDGRRVLPLQVVQMVWVDPQPLADFLPAAANGIRYGLQLRVFHYSIRTEAAL